MSLPVKFNDGRMSIKKEKNYSFLIYDIVCMNKMAGKTGPFHEDKLNMNIILGIFSYLENLLLFQMILNKVSAHL